MTNINTAKVWTANEIAKDRKMMMADYQFVELYSHEALQSALLEAQELNKVLVEALELVVKHGYGVNIEKNLKVRNTAFVAKEALAKFKQMRGEG